MSDFTLINLRDAEDMTASSPLADQVQFRRLRSELESEHLGLGHFALQPGFRVPFGHRHGEQEEVYVILAGGGRIKIEDEVLELRQWDAVRLPPETARAFEAGPDGLELLAIGFAEGGDAETLKDFWD